MQLDGAVQIICNLNVLEDKNDHFLLEVVMDLNGPKDGAEGT